MNKFIITGRLTAEPDIRSTPTGKTVARFNFAVNRDFKKEGEPEADFFQCVAFGNIADVFHKCRISKGTKLLIEGRVQNNNYEKDGVKYYGNQVIVNSFEFCESKTASGNTTSAPTPTTSPEANFEVVANEDDLPF